MPSRPNTPCRHPGCSALVPYGQKYCEAHKALHPEEVRSASGRGYGRAWQRERKRYLEAHHLGNACKYLCRAGKKNPEKTTEDLRKAVWYINRYIELLVKEAAK